MMGAAEQRRARIADRLKRALEELEQAQVEVRPTDDSTLVRGVDNAVSTTRYSLEFVRRARLAPAGPLRDPNGLVE